LFAAGEENSDRSDIVIERNGSVLSIMMLVIEYSAWGAITLLFVWGGINYKNKLRRKRIPLAIVWILVIMCAASTVDMFCGRMMYSVRQRDVLLIEFVLIFVAASFMTYRSIRRAASIKNGSGGPGGWPTSGQ
jgi:type IV secretory pathway TraG/TraD family ATPase VirD4